MDEIFEQQGDVILGKRSKLKPGLRDLKTPVLLHSDTTNHTHKLLGDGATVLLDETNKTQWIHAPNGARLVHEEHKDVILDPGAYEMRIVQEYDYDTEERRNVVD